MEGFCLFVSPAEAAKAAPRTSSPAIEDVNLVATAYLFQKLRVASITLGQGMVLVGRRGNEARILPDVFLISRDHDVEMCLAADGQMS